MTKCNCNCECSGAAKPIFTCSGASDTGELTDRAARKMTREGLGSMYCLAGIGGKVSGILKTTKFAQAILAIDGCPLSCTKRTLENAGFKNILHIQLAELGMIKGKTTVNENNICRVSEKGKNILEEICS